MKKIGEMIAKVRNEKGLSQIQLADKMGISRDVLSKWERDVNKIPYHQLALLAECLETPIIFSERGIFAGKEAIQMSQIYSTSFKNFSVLSLKTDFEHNFKQFEKNLVEKTSNEIQQLENKGFVVRLSSDLFNHLEFSHANQQELDEEVIIYLPKHSFDTPYLKIINTGYLHIKYLDIQQLFEDLGQSYEKNVRDVTEKGILYGCMKENLGSRLFGWAEQNGTTEELIRICPYVQDVAKEIKEQCSNVNYVKTLENEDFLITRTEEWQWIWNLNLYDLYQDHEWRIFWNIDGEEREVEDMDTCHFLGQALEVIESIVETDYEDILDELEIEED